MGSKILKVGVDIGGTNVRLGFVRSDRPELVYFHAAPAPRRANGEIDLHRLVERAAERILKKTTQLERGGWRVIRQIGVSAPGAYLPDGRVYRGTAPNIPALEGVKLYRLFARRLGPGWRVTAAHVNNDGVLQGWVLADRYVKSSGMKSGKIIVMVPGTGFGAGVFRVLKGRVKPIAGPQQLFDVVIRKAKRAEAIILPDRMTVRPALGREPLMAENLLTGRALSRLGTHFLKRPVDGGMLSAVALGSRNPKEKAEARNVFLQLGRDLVRFITVVASGRYKKLRVPYRPPTRGASVFILGGWFLRGAARSLALREAQKVLRGKRNVSLVPADKISGLPKRPHEIGVIGAAMEVEIRA